MFPVVTLQPGNYHSFLQNVIPKGVRSARFHQRASSLEEPCVLSMEKQSYVYMMGSASRRALYTGVTATLRKRVFEHKNDLIDGFTSKYKCHRLVYFETFNSITDAIAREKEIKGWRREKKEKLVESLNPAWKDLAADWFPQELMLHGKPVRFGCADERKVPRAYGRADDSVRPLNGSRDDES